MSEPVGKKIDFLMQEFNREAKTMSASGKFEWAKDLPESLLPKEEMLEVALKKGNLFIGIPKYIPSANACALLSKI